MNDSSALFAYKEARLRIQDFHAYVSSVTKVSNFFGMNEDGVFFVAEIPVDLWNKHICNTVPIHTLIEVERHVEKVNGVWIVRLSLAVPAITSIIKRCDLISGRWI